MSEGTPLIWVAATGLVAAAVATAWVSRGHELGCTLAVFPVVLLGCTLTAALVLLLFTGWNWVTFLVTDGNCARRECLYKGEYPPTCRLPPWLSSPYCVRRN